MSAIEFAGREGDAVTRLVAVADLLIGMFLALAEKARGGMVAADVATGGETIRDGAV